MKTLKTIRDILFIAFIAILALIIIDYSVYDGYYTFLYAGLDLVLLLATVISSIVIFDLSHSNISLIDSLKNGESFKLPVCKVHTPTYKEQAYAKYMRILNGLD